MDTLVLEFEGVPGEIVTRLSPVSVNEFYAVVDAYGDGTWADRAAIEKVYAAFAPLLVSWTFDPPATAEGLADIDAKLSFAIIRRWMDGVRDVPPPLPRTSSAGGTSPGRKASRSRQRSPAPSGSATSS